jgi:hypothetical protein
MDRARRRRRQGLDRHLPASSSWCFIIADEKGYFRDENIEADRRDFQFFKEGQIKVAVQPEDVLDRRFVDYAVQALGPYARPGQ